MNTEFTRKNETVSSMASNRRMLTGGSFYGYARKINGIKRVALTVCLLMAVSANYAQKSRNIIANPMNLNYRFQFDEPSRREAADPVCEYFNGKYYLFASKTGGYWSSPDLANWTYIPSKTLLTQENYAPTILAMNGMMYYMIGGAPRIFCNPNPDADDWKELDTRFEHGTSDPAFYYDEDTGKTYIYWGCSDKDPIMGVEVDAANGFKSVGAPIVLIDHHTDIYGWEVPGEQNEEPRIGWNEGAAMLKYGGRYYLQYAAPGTQYRTYGDGVYVGDTPLGPFKYAENNPFSIKPGGFIGGAGHGHTFKDKYGNYWHVASMKISQRHWFERRLGLFPVYFDDGGDMFAHTVWTDYPFAIPQEKTDFIHNDLAMKWNLLSYNKKAVASSSVPKHEPEKASNEDVEDWWAALTGNAGEWWQTDLGARMTVNAVQVNFADEDFSAKAPDSYVYYQYKIERSDDGKTWKLLTDKTLNTTDSPHELITLDKAVKTRFLRITNTKDVEGKFSISGFRVFGKGKGRAPGKVSGLKVQREADKRRFSLQWDKLPSATGYIVRWGVKSDRLNNAVMVFRNEFEAGYFNRDSEYSFSVSAFNENGVVISK
jgi:hypothetical protein